MAFLLEDGVSRVLVEDGSLLVEESGIVPITGTASATLGGATCVASGAVTIIGPVIATLGNAVATTTQGYVIGPPLAPAAMPRISLGKPVFGTSTPTKMVDNGYGYTATDPGAWACAATDWVAVNVGVGPSQVLVGLSADDRGGINGSYIVGAFEAYRIQTSPDSTNGVDGTWTTRVTVTGNNIFCREHLVTFTGEKWVKLIVDTTTGGFIDELDVWDASAGTENTFAFVGDSITLAATSRPVYFGGGNRPSFQDVVETNNGSYPYIAAIATVGTGAADWVTPISAELTRFPDVKYWCLCLGTNNASGMPGNLAAFIADMTSIINTITTAGRVPILCRAPYTGAAAYGGGANYFTTLLKQMNDDGINVLQRTLGVRAGPDLYKLFYDNRVAYVVTTDPHGSEAATQGWQAAWANSLSAAAVSVTGTVAATLGNATLAASGTVSAGSTVTGTVAATLGNATSAASGGVGAVGSLVKTLTNTTASAAGGVGASGSTSAALSSTTASAAGSTVAGSLAKALGDSASAATGSVGAGGSIARALGDSTLSASGSHSIAGSLTRQLGDSTLAAAGSSTVGSVARALGSTTCAADGNVSSAGAITGSLAVTLSNTSASAAGSTVAGSLAATLSSTSVSATGGVGASGSTSAALSSTTASASGGVGAAGSLARQLAGATSVAAGSSTSGTVAQTLASATLAASGSYTDGVSGSLTRQLGDATLSAAGARGAAGVASSVLSDAALAATGRVIATGTLAKALSNASVLASGGVGAAGSLTKALGSTTCVAAGSFLGNVTGSVSVVLGDSLLVSMGALASLPFVMLSSGRSSRAQVSTSLGPSQVADRSTTPTKVNVI